jgi:formate hydrogenlyase transcriptional activator
LPANLIESELFGHERGAFTGANERRIGKFELAHHGTIFLDEIGELPLELQAKLLRVLQEGEVERIGGKMPLKINLRVVAATNRNLRREVAEKRFRQDLYFRLNTVVLVLPSLRERREDIPALALHFAEKYGNRIGRKIRGISNKMLEALMNYEFPGNVRELEHIIEESVIFSKGETLQLHRPLKFAPDSPIASPLANNSSNKSLADIEREHILATLKQTGGRIRGADGAAEILQIKPTTLEARMKKLGIKKLHANISPEI